MASIDLKDTFLNIPITTQSQRFLRLAVNMGKQIPNLQLSASFRPFIHSANIHKDDGSAWTTSSSGDRSDLLSRWPFFATFRVKLQEDLVRACSHLKTLGCIINLKLGPLSRCTIFGLPNRFRGTTDLLTGVEDNQSQKYSFFVTNQSTSIDQKNHVGFGDPDLDKCQPSNGQEFISGLFRNFS